MNKLNATFSQKILFDSAVIVFMIHILFGLLRYFITISDYYIINYILGGVIAVTGILYYKLYRPKLRLNTDFSLLLVLLAWYLISCMVMNKHYNGNYFVYNKDPLFDTAFLFLIIYPMGKYAAKHGLDPFSRIVLHIFLLCWTLFMIYVLENVLQNHIISTPNGGQIGMSSNIQLYLNCNPNTTGAIELVMTMLCLCMVIWNKGWIWRIIYGISTSIHFIILILSNSRTCFYAILVFFVAVAFMAIVNCKWNKTKTRFLIAGIIAILVGFCFYYFRDLAFDCHESITHLRELLTGSSEGSAARESTGSTINAISSGRISIYGFALKAMVYNTQRFLTGVTPAAVNAVISQIGGPEYNTYTHNQFLEIGVALGVPCMAVFIAWLYTVVKNSIKLCFKHKEGLAVLLVPIVVAVLLLANMPEATLLFYRFLTSYIFFFMCAWIIGRAEIKEAESLNMKKQKSRKKR